MAAFRNLIQRIPRGFLAFLDVKAGGTYPSVLGELLQPTFDLQQFYKAEALHFTAAGTPVGTTIGGTQLPFTTTSVEDLVAGAGALIVPNTQIWLINQATVECGHATAGDVFDAAFEVSSSSITNRFYIPPNTLAGNPYDAAANVMAYRSISDGILAGPGMELSLRVLKALAAAGTPFSPLLRFTLLRFQV